MHSTWLHISMYAFSNQIVHFYLLAIISFNILTYINVTYFDADYKQNVHVRKKWGRFLNKYPQNVKNLYTFFNKFQKRKFCSYYYVYFLIYIIYICHNVLRE